MTHPKRVFLPSDITSDILKLAFDIFIINGKKRVKCKHCRFYKQSAVHSTRQKAHLIKCRSFMNSLSDDFWRQIPRPPASQLLISPGSFPGGKKSHEEIDQLLGMSIFTGARPFSTFDSNEMRLLVSALDPTYRIPGINKIIESILPHCYATVQDEVFQKITKSQYLNVSLDESTDIRKRRILNISVSDSKRSYFIGLRDLQDETATAENLANWIITELQDLTNNDLSRINSITTDTCSTMHSLWGILASREETKHVFSLGCDSHGLQLLIKDIILLPSISKVFRNAQLIVTHFNTAPLQLAVLRQTQLQEYKEERALLGSIITRWGSQYLMLQSLKNNEKALTQYVRDNRCKDEIKSILRSMDFWDDLSQILVLLKPIHEHIKASEAVASHAGCVLRRWFGIMRHLETFQKSWTVGNDISSYMASRFHDRMRRQVQDLHWAAYYLNPLIIHEDMPSSLQGKVFQAIERYCTQKPQEATLQFAQFRTSAGEFFQSRCWSHKTDPKSFWEVQKSTSQASRELSTFALRLFNTTATSAPSERAFSAQNRQLTLSRNRMTSAHTDMVTFIYLNARSLRDEQEIEDNNDHLAEEDNLISRWGEMPHILEEPLQLENETALIQAAQAAQVLQA